MAETKKINVNIYGIEKFLDAQDADGEPIDARSRFSVEEDIVFEIDGEEYTPSDFGEENHSNDDFEGVGEIDAEEFFKESEAEKGMLYWNKASCEFEIELPEDEEFDPEKVSLVYRDFIYPDGSDEAMLVAFIYDGKVYNDCYPMDSIGKGGRQIWKAPVEGAVEATGEAASDEQLADASKVPVLVFRQQMIRGCFLASEDRLEKLNEGITELNTPGVVAMTDDDDEGIAFISDNLLEDLNDHDNITMMIFEDGLEDCELSIDVTTKYALVNCDDKPDSKKILETIAAVWSYSSQNCEYRPAFDKLIVRVVAQDLSQRKSGYTIYTDHYDDYLLDNGKTSLLSEEEFDEIIAGLSEEDQALVKEITTPPEGEDCEVKYS